MFLKIIFIILFSAFSPLYASIFDPSTDPPYNAAILLEAETGAILFAYKPHLQRSPASTQKLLLELVVLNAIAQGKYALDEPVQVSAWASRMGGSQVYLKQGEVFSLAELM